MQYWGYVLRFNVTPQGAPSFLSCLTEDGSRHWTPDPADFTNDDMPHWYRFRPSAIAVETTGYALLAQLALGEITYAGSVALWLSEQQNYQGGFVSTQVRPSSLTLQGCFQSPEVLTQCWFIWKEGNNAVSIRKS